MQLVMAFSPPHRQRRPRHADQDHESTQAPLRTGPDRPGPGNPGRVPVPRLRGEPEGARGPVRQGREDDDRADRVLHDRHRHHVAHRSQEDRQDARQVAGAVLRPDDPVAADRPGRGAAHQARPGHAHRPDPPRPVGGRERDQDRAAGLVRRVRPAHRPGHVLRRLRRGPRAAGAVPGHPVRLRPQQDRSGRAGGAERHQQLLAHAVRGLRLPDAAGPGRRVRRDGVHRRQVRHQVHRLARPADRARSTWPAASS